MTRRQLTVVVEHAIDDACIATRVHKYVFITVSKCLLRVETMKETTVSLDVVTSSASIRLCIGLD